MNPLSKVDRQTIVLLLLTFGGAQIPGLFTNSKPAQSIDCRPYWEHNPWANAPASQASTKPAKGLTISDREIDAAIAREQKQPAPVQQAIAPLAVPAAPAIEASQQSTPIPPASPAMATQTVEQQAAALDLEIDQDIARSKGVSVQEYRTHVEKYAGDNVPL